MKKVLVAVSGGLDSAATVLLLKRQGFEVAAVTLDMIGNNDNLAVVHDLCARMDIPLFTEDVRGRFAENVADYFLQEYMRGRTPAPCSVCNPQIKWKILSEVADREGYHYISTGHYVNITEHNGRRYISKGCDVVKDQSYYLWDLGQEILSRAMTPLGERTKSEIRLIMNASGFGDLSVKKESMGVCFLGKGGHTELLEREVSGIERLRNGEVVDRSGVVIGRHSGYPFYTVGQKRGFETTSQGDHYILRIDAENNRLTVGKIEDLYFNRLRLGRVRIIDQNEFLTSEKIKIKIRGLGLNPRGYCAVSLENGRFTVTIKDPAYAPAPGQPVVFYIDDRVIGGGILEEFDNI